MKKILIKDTQYLTMVSPEIQQGDILINGSVIEAIGLVEPMLLTDCQLEIIDGTKALTLPGLVNTHNHAGMTLVRSYADDMELMPWLTEKIWPVEAKMQDEDIYWGTQLAIVEMIASGTTTFTDMYSSMDHVAQAVAETGIRADLSRGCIEATDHQYRSIAENKSLFDKWHNGADGRIHVRFGPHAPYTCSPGYLTKLIETAADCGAGMHIHVAETLDEIRQIQEAYGKTPVEHLEGVGVFQLPTLAAHCVHLSEQDMQIMAKHHVAVAHCPISNMKLASGIAPIVPLMKMGIHVGLGTDGASSNNSMNLMRDMSMCAYLHKVANMDPTVMAAYEILHMATLGGAQALDWANEIGSLEVGKQADMIMIDLDKPHYYPLNNSLSDLVYSSQGSDVKNSIINGRVVMRDYQFVHIDIERIKTNALQSAKRITQ